jgi:hypothetical protein
MPKPHSMIDSPLGWKVLDHLPRGNDGDNMREAILHRLAEVLAEERMECAQLVLSMDSGMGNEKRIAQAILQRDNDVPA